MNSIKETVKAEGIHDPHRILEDLNNLKVSVCQEVSCYIAMHTPSIINKDSVQSYIQVLLNY